MQFIAIITLLMVAVTVGDAKHRHRKRQPRSPQQQVIVFRSQDRECPAQGVKQPPLDRPLVVQKPQ